MSAAERNFATFYLGDNVYELAEGVLPDIAERLDLKLAIEPNSGDMQAVLDNLKRNKVLRHGIEITAIDQDTKAELIDRSGIQSALSRSLHSPEYTLEPNNIDALIMLGGMANWQHRSVEVIPGAFKGIPIFTVGGTRVMNTATETVREDVMSLAKKNGGYPTEAQYMAKVIVPRLVKAGHTVIDQDVDSYKSADGDSLLRQLFTKHSHLARSNVAMVRVANAGIIMAIQMSQAARTINENFDMSPAEPQAYVLTDSRQVARTDEQEIDAFNYQKADPAISQLVLTAKKLHLYAGGE